MDKILKILKIWSKLAVNLRLRDRSVKILQYGCQMLLGYYARKFSGDMRVAISTTRSAASLSRKAFWMLKSLNHVNEIVNMLADGVLTDSSISAKLLLMEQIFLAIYYWTENLVFFIRVKLLKIDEEDVDGICNWSWFGGDMCCLIAAILNLQKQSTKLSEAVRRSDAGDNDDSHLRVMKRQLFDHQLSVAIAIFEVGVSAHYVKIFKEMLGEDISDGHVGLMGVLSSSLILYEGYLKIQKDEY